MSYQPTAYDHAVLIDDSLHKLKIFPSLNICEKAELAGEVARLLEYLKDELYGFESKALEAEFAKQAGSARIGKVKQQP